MTKRITALVVLAISMAACNSAAGADGVATLEETVDTAPAVGGSGTDASLDVETQMLAFAQCMRDEGVDMEDPTVDADGNLGFGGFRGPGGGQEDGGQPDGFREAIAVCQPMLDGLELGFGRANQTDLQDTLLEYAQCMRDNGYAMDDPDLTTFGPGSGEEGAENERRAPFGDVDFEDPAFQAAQTVCGDVLGGFGPGGQGRPGAGSGQDS